VASALLIAIREQKIFQAGTGGGGVAGLLRRLYLGPAPRGIALIDYVAAADRAGPRWGEVVRGQEPRVRSKIQILYLERKLVPLRPQ
jgi:hypothetical protein